MHNAGLPLGLENVFERKIEAGTEDGQQRRKQRKRNAESDENRRPEAPKIEKMKVRRGSWDTFLNLRPM